jgi:hypothetical protein
MPAEYVQAQLDAEAAVITVMEDKLLELKLDHAANCEAVAASAAAAAPAKPEPAVDLRAAASQLDARDVETLRLHSDEGCASKKPLSTALADHRRDLQPDWLRCEMHLHLVPPGVDRATGL